MEIRIFSYCIIYFFNKNKILKMLNRNELNDNMQEISKTLEFLRIKRNSVCMEIENNENKRNYLMKNLKKLQAELYEVKGIYIIN